MGMVLAHALAFGQRLGRRRVGMGCPDLIGNAISGPRS